VRDFPTTHTRGCFGQLEALVLGLDLHIRACPIRMFPWPPERGADLPERWPIHRSAVEHTVHEGPHGLSEIRLASTFFEPYAGILAPLVPVRLGAKGCRNR
jgi:hypothetical protein